MVGMGKVDKNQIPRYTPHSLRHGFVIDLIDNQNVKLTDVSKIVRHSSIRTTYDIYYSKDNKNLKSILDSL
jgi:integrase